MLLGEAALLFVPLRLARQRPVSRRSLWVPILASGLLAGGLSLGAVTAIDEFIRAGFEGNLWWGWPALALILGVWVTWAAVFWWYARRRSPREVAGRLQLWLFRSSLLTLLVAVPTHVVARQRDYCCAGFNTFIGIAFGLPVLLLSFGPGIFWLYVRRWKQIHPEASAPPPADEATPPPTRT
jgi:hypothetical protein